jgi:nitrite reductase (NADH) large subunit
METNVKGIYAAGDVSRAPDFFSNEKVSYGLWPSAVEQGEIAGKNMGGGNASYPGNFKMNVTRVFAMPIASIGDVGSKRVKEVLMRQDEKRAIYRKICLDEKGVLIGAILINQVDDVGILLGLIRERKEAEFLKSRSIWRSPMSYGHIYMNILQGKL